MFLFYIVLVFIILLYYLFICITTYQLHIIDDCILPLKNCYNWYLYNLFCYIPTTQLWVIVLKSLWKSLIVGTLCLTSPLRYNLQHVRLVQDHFSNVKILHCFINKLIVISNTTPADISLRIISYSINYLG